MFPNENYIICKISTNETQILHHITFPKYTTNKNLEDFRTKERFQTDVDCVFPQDSL